MRYWTIISNLPQLQTADLLLLYCSLSVHPSVFLSVHLKQNSGKNYWTDLLHFFSWRDHFEYIMRYFSILWFHLSCLSQQMKNRPQFNVSHSMACCMVWHPTLLLHGLIPSFMIIMLKLHSVILLSMHSTINLLSAVVYMMTCAHVI